MISASIGGGQLIVLGLDRAVYGLDASLQLAIDAAESRAVMQVAGS